MDYRKLMSFSKGSYIVTMPKSWIEKNKLKKGDTISIEEGQSELVFHASQKDPARKDKEICIEWGNKKVQVVRAEIVSAYLNNFNTIEIRASDIVQDSPIIKGIIRNLSGMEIIEQTSNKIVAQDLIDVNSISILNIIRRMDVITRSLMNELMLCIEGKFDSKRVLQGDLDVNRLYFLGYRVIKNIMDNPNLLRKLNLDVWEVANYRSVIIRIEEIADTQKRISRLVSNAMLKDEVLDGIKDICNDIRKSYNDAMKAFYTKDRNLALEIEVDHRNMILKCNRFLEDVSKRLSVEIKDSKQPETLSRNNLVPIANIVEFQKLAWGYIKRLARVVLSMD
jgi:phosphate uptake regulator